MKINRFGFTLVELIVVVTILALLSTIGFVSYSSYLSGVRDTNRLSQLVAISDGLELYRTKKTLPIPDDNIEIRANGTVVGYQGYAGVNVLETMDYSKTGKDPKDKTYFSYYLTQNKKHYQLLTYLEEEENLETKLNLINKVKADTDYTNRYPKVSGKKLGILTQSGTNIPVQEVTTLVSSGYLDIATTTDSYVARLTDDRNYSGTGTKLVGSLPYASCKRIKQMGLSRGDMTYTINPAGNNPLKVYCDMTTDGGGWTLVGISEGTSNGVEILVDIALGDISYIDSNSSAKLDTDTINKLVFLGDNKLRVNDKTSSEKWIIEYSDGQTIDFTTYKTYNIRLIDSEKHKSIFYDSHPNFILFAGISTDTFISSLCPSGCRQSFGEWNTATNSLGIVGSIWHPFIRRSGGDIGTQYFNYKLRAK